MTLSIEHVYSANLGHGPQPVRFLEVGRLWAVDPYRGGLALADLPPLSRARHNPPPPRPKGYLALTRHTDSTLPRAWPDNRFGRAELAATLAAYPMPRLAADPRQTAATVCALMPELTEAGLAVTLVNPLRHHLGPWTDFPAQLAEAH